MIDFSINQWEKLNYFWLLAALALILWAARINMRRRLARFATPNRLKQLIGSHSTRKAWLQTIGLMLVLFTCILALLDIRWGRTTRDVPQQGIEIVFALDVSRSMLAQDVVPNRLERAKQDIRDMIDAMAGNRIGLVVFAGDAVRILPLTTHYQDFKQNLAVVTPLDVTRGGTNLSSALLLAAESFSQANPDHRAIVLITDGEDHESDPIAVAKQLYQEQGVRVFTVGIGDMKEGSLVPDTLGIGGSQTTGRYLKHDGELVRSRLDAKTLQSIAQVSNAAFVPAGTQRVDMSQVYARYIEPLGTTDFESAQVEVYISRYPWFLALGLGLIVLETILSCGLLNREKSKAIKVKQSAGGTLSKATLAGSLALACSFLPTAELQAQNRSALSNDSNPSQSKSDVQTEAESIQRQIDLLQPTLKRDNDPRLAYNLGLLHVQRGQLDEARALFTRVAGSSDAKLAGLARYNLGNLDYQIALDSAESSPTASMELLQSAIDHYRAALRTDRQDQDARANIELANRFMQQLMEQQPQDSQDQDQPDQQPSEEDSDGADGDSEDADGDPKDSSESDDAQDDQASDSSQQQSDESSDQGDGEATEDQSEDGSEGESSTDDSTTDRSEAEGDEQDDKSSDSKADSEQQETSEREETDDSRTAPTQPDRTEHDSAEQDIESSPQTPQQEDGIDAEGELKGINEQQPVAEEGSDLPEGVTMTEQEAQKMMQAIRDRELLRRLQQLRAKEARRIPVDRDW